MDIVAILTKGGVPYDDAVTIADLLAAHASEEEQKAITHAADSTPEHLQVQILRVTTLIMAGIIRDSKQYLNEALSNKRANRAQR